MNRLLVIDTAQSYPILGIVEFGRPLALAGSVDGPDSLHILLRDVLCQSSRSATLLLPELDAIVVSTGPGRFTSLRGGVAFAKGLAAAQVPVVGVPSISALAEAATNLPTAVLIPAGRGRYYLARSDRQNDIRTVELEQVVHIVPPSGSVVGDVPAKHREALQAQGLQPYTVSPRQLVKAMTRLARKLLNHGQGPAQWTAVPRYVTPPTRAQAATWMSRA